MAGNKTINISRQTGPTRRRHGFIPGMTGSLAVLLIAGALLVWWSVQRADHGMRRALLLQARLVARSLNVEAIRTLSGNETDLLNPAYLEFKRQLSAVNQAHDQARFIYLMGRRPDGGIFFFVDNEPPGSEDYSPPGQIYEEATPDFQHLFSTEAEAVIGPETDRWGTWVSAHIPLHDPHTGHLMAVLGMDVDARDWQRSVLAEAVWPMGLIVLVMVLLVLSYALAFSRRRALDYQTALQQSHEIMARASAETERQHRLLESLLEAIPAPVFFKDRNGRYLGCNPAFEAITGKKEAEIIGKRPQDLWPEKFSSTYRDKDMELLESGGKQQYEFKYAGAATDQERDVVFYKSTFRDQAGAVDGIVGVMLDITERKQAEAELLRLKLAIEQTGEVIIITDPDGIIQYVNPAFEHVTGYTRQEALEQNPRLLKSGRQDEAFYRGLWETITSGRTWHGRMVNRRRDGSFYTEEATISPVHDADGRIINYVALKRDITEHIRLTGQLQMAQKMDAVGRLAGGVAHDFNNMLNVIIGHTELALEGLQADDFLHESLKEILDAARRSAETTRQLLAFARKQTITPETIDLNVVLSGMRKILQRLIGEDIDLVFKPARDLWPVNIDPAQIDQILVNLLINAREAIPGTGIIVMETDNVRPDNASCVDHDGLVPGDYVLLAVRDNGRGVSKEALGKLFEPFFTTKGASEGAGLGLATVYGIVKQNNGFIYADSEPGQGTTFRIYLPRYADRGDRIRTSESAGGGDLAAGGKTLLIVEDEASVRKLVGRILDRFGFAILFADGPAAALKLAAAHNGPIDLLISDVIMPEMNGRELADRLRAFHPELTVLYMSGYTADVIGQRGMLGTDVHFIQKPFSNQGLVNKVKEALGD